MRLPVLPPVSPMLAKAAAELPDGPVWRYEPKWDGFRCIVFRDGDEVELGSRNERPLTRYFPEVVEAVRARLPERCVLDGEIVVPAPGGAGLDFDRLLERIHPAASRVNKLAAETPASFVAFDCLAVDDEDLRDAPFDERRARLEALLAGVEPPCYLTPLTADRATGLDWFRRFEGAGLDGVIAKRGDGPYVSGERVMIKVKHRRTADCVVAGYRVHKDGKGVGSLLLGLYDEAGNLHHVGVAASFTAVRRRELMEELQPLTEGALDDHPWRGWAEAAMQWSAQNPPTRMPGAGSRWNAGKDLSWVALRPDRVAEVEFDQLQGQRFRRVAAFLRWRPDREPRSCTYDQLEVAPPLELAALFAR